MPFIFLALLVAALAGVVRPYKGMRRWQFSLAAFTAVVGIGATAPKSTPEQLAAKKEAEARKLVNTTSAEHAKVVAKAQPALNSSFHYDKKEYRQTLARVGATTFAKLDDLEPGAAFAAAESRQCNKVTSAMISDQSRRGKAVWFVDCENGNRFMIDQAQAALALGRYKGANLRLRDLESSCTQDDTASCKATPTQKAAIDREVEFVSECDLLLQQALVSPSSLSMHGQWSTAFGDADTIIFRREFDSQNSFGAMIRSRYRCDVNSASGNISRFEVQGPTGGKRFL